MKNSKKKTVKGMTLIEIIISIAVLGIMGTLMCIIGQTACKMMLNTNHLNNKTTVEAPVAISRDVATAQTARNDSQGNAITIPAATQLNNGISIKSSKFGTINYNVKRYTTAPLADEVGDQAHSATMNGDLVFYTIDP
jgi:prepilin-type N-terminal cleavage/methylation domain-containing protein